MVQDTLTELVARASAGDPDALQRLILHYHDRLRRLIDGRIPAELRRFFDADDVLQQTYVTAFKSIDSCEFDSPGAFYRWLEKITVTRFADQERALRRQKRDVSRQIPASQAFDTSYPELLRSLIDSDGTPSRHLAQHEAVAAVMSCLARLTDDQRTVIRLRFLEGRPVDEVADRLERNEAAVHSLCHRGLKSLRRLLMATTKLFET